MEGLTAEGNHRGQWQKLTMEGLTTEGLTMEGKH